MGGNRINYPGDCGTPTVDMVTVKLHLNSVISTNGARYCTIDLKDFYLMTPMTRPEYMRMKLKDLPTEFVQLYRLTDKVDTNGYIHIKIQKGMYGLPQAGIVLTIAQIIKAVMTSAAEAEIGALYINCREAVPARHTLEYMGHPQPPTPMQTDNTTALGVVNNNVMKKLKAMDMKYH